MQNFGLQQQFFPTGAAAVELDGWEHPFFIQAAIEVDLAVTRAFEFLKNHFVHAAARIDQGRANDGQGAALFNFARGTEKSFGALQCIGVHTAREHLAGAWHHVVISAGQAGDGVQQDDHIFFQFHQTFGTFNHNFCHMHVARCGLVKGGGDHLATHTALHFGHFFGALVHQQNHHVAVGVVGGDGMGNVLHHHGFTALGRCDEQGALAFANRGNDVNDATGDVFFAFDVTLQTHLLFGKQGCQVLEHDFVFVVFGQIAIDLVQLGQSKVTLAVFGNTHFAFDHVASVQIEAAHLAGADVDIVRAGGVAGVRAAQKAKTVRQNFQHTVGKYLLTGARAFFDDGKHQLLLAHAAGVFDFERFGLLEHFRHVQCLEFVQMHGKTPAMEFINKRGGGGAAARAIRSVWDPVNRVGRGISPGRL